MKNLRFLKYVGFGILGIGFVILAIFVTMSLWNWLIPMLVPWSGINILADSRVVPVVKDTAYRCCPGWTSQ